MKKKSKNSSKKVVKDDKEDNLPPILTAAQLETLDWDDISSLIIDLEIELDCLKNFLTDEEIAKYKRYIALCEDTKYDLAMQESEPTWSFIEEE